MAYRNLSPNKFVANDLSSPQIVGVLASLENTTVLSVNIYEHFNTQETKAIGRGILALLLNGSKKNIQTSSKLVGGPFMAHGS